MRAPSISTMHITADYIPARDDHDREVPMPDTAFFALVQDRVWLVPAKSAEDKQGVRMGICVGGDFTPVFYFGSTSPFYSPMKSSLFIREDFALHFTVRQKEGDDE